MVDIGRISSRKWAIAMLIFLCVSAVLFIAPWILSVFYESEPYENWDEELRLMSQATTEGGNTTLWCASGPCVACTSTEKADPKFKCSPTGYHKAQKCAKDRDAVDISKKPKGEGSTDGIENPIEGKDQKPADENGNGGTDPLKLVADDVSQIPNTYKTCIPQEVKEKLSVFGFEGVVLMCLLLSAPAVHYRKKRGAVPQGLQRIPSSVRF